ncbi:MAG: M20 family metallopeptidase [Chloroflexi bacterium]|nr:M20 family metallopeptidase [Chloroflexota bacterium]
MAGVEAKRSELVQLSQLIHSHPELGFQEHQAVEWLSSYLRDEGFAIRTRIGDLPTAFRADYGSGRPVIAFLAEYDALPKIGHACGHNIIATASVGAAVSLRPVVDEWGGQVIVMGTPAEELYGGKAILAERGAFSGLDVAMIVHPGVRNKAQAYALACIGLDVEFAGRAAHAAAAPEEGINALEAMILSFTAINSLRQHVDDKARIHGVITDGGEAANVVPAHSAGSFLVRAEDEDYLDLLQQRVLDCFKGAAQATGARLSHRWADVKYRPMRTNQTLAEAFARNLHALGRAISEEPPKGMGSTDMGNVSHLVPSVHPTIAIAPVGVQGHSPEFAQAAASEAGVKGLLDGAKAMAMTAVDVITNPDLLARAHQEFQQAMTRQNAAKQGATR